MNISPKINMLQEPCTAIGIYPNVTAVYIGDIITFFVTVEPSTQPYFVEIRDQNNNLIGTCTAYNTCFFNWDTTGQAAGIYDIRATTNGCSASIPIPIELVTACTSINLSADKMSVSIGDTVTFTVTVQPSAQSYWVEIIDQDGHLVAPICATSSGVCSSSWNTAGRTVGTYNIRAIVGECVASIPITLLPACTSVSLSVDKISTYIGDGVTFTTIVQPSTQSYPAEIRDQDNNLIGICATSGGICSVSWNTTGVEAKSYIITARAGTTSQCISNPVLVTLEKNPLGIIIAIAGLAAAIIYIATRKRRPKSETGKMEIHISK